MTPSQQSIYRPLVQKAFEAHCKLTGDKPQDRIAKEHWYRKALMNRFGIYTTKELEPITPEILDELLLLFALAADDQYWIDRATRGPELRAMWQLEQAMKSVRVSWEYVHGIARQMGFLTSTDEGQNIKQTIGELPAELILKLVKALRVYSYRQARAKKEPVHA